ncbi:MAG: malic enzyme-like NAD(P)-binding protein, partial [bacterium]
NPRNLRGSAEDALRGADVFIGLSGPGAIRPRALARMATRAIVFALANPDPEVPPEIAARYARVVATGRSDYPNQINNALAFPGVFKGALEVRARRITPAMEVAAARAIAGIIRPEELSEETIVPSIFNPRVVPAVARAVARAAVRGGVSRRALPIT